MPDFTCCSCEGLFFSHSVVAFNVDKIRLSVSEDIFSGIYNNNSKLICKTCNSYVSRDKIPKLSTSNGLKFVNIPHCLKIISPLEERMVPPYINFMQIRPLKSFVRNPQFGLKESVVNILVEISDILKVLLRSSIRWRHYS